MNFKIIAKNYFSRLPYSLGNILNRIPYAFRPGIGISYQKYKNQILEFEKYSIDEKYYFIFNRMYKLVEFSYNNVPFYNKYYCDNYFHPTDLKDFNDIQKIPIVNKSILNQFDIEFRSSVQKSRILVNTGGTSGSPFHFYIQPISMSVELSHMHTIWETLNYKPFDLKLVFGGRSTVHNVIQYDSLRHHFSLDIYSENTIILKKIQKYFSIYNIKYLHGYPSAIYEFALLCENNIEILKLLQKNLKGILLSSEFPVSLYRNKIEDVFKVKTISWYGHTERAVLAYEKDIKYQYQPFLTYGYTEAIQNSNNSFDLISTSYYNYASPLIRYNTQDLISDLQYDELLLKSFYIKQGRIGEFVVDRFGKQISVTALIFGRHHELFNYIQFIQLKQISPGYLDIYYVSNIITELEAAALFDNENFNFILSFHKISSPIRTISGKVKLLIND